MKEKPQSWSGSETGAYENHTWYFFVESRDMGLHISDPRVEPGPELTSLM